jgi:hypothetical protein
MNHKKVANENHEETARLTTRSVSRHGLSEGVAREKRIRNRAAKRHVERLAIEEQVELLDDNIVEFGAPPRPLVEVDIPLPDDYEACGDCGYDHVYEPVESTIAHGGATH